MARKPGNKVPIEDRFWTKVNKTDSCWLWTASTNASGYGQINDGAGKIVRAHRWLYERTNGPVPPGMHLDHLCRVRHCVNPAHLEVVTPKENFLRGHAPTVLLHHSGKCKEGHDLIRHDYPSRTRWQCRECHAKHSSATYYRRRQREAS